MIALKKTTYPSEKKKQITSYLPKKWEILIDGFVFIGAVQVLCLPSNRGGGGNLDTDFGRSSFFLTGLVGGKEEGQNLLKNWEAQYFYQENGASFLFPEKYKVDVQNNILHALREASYVGKKTFLWTYSF